MGKIADAIEQVECDLEEALEEIEELKKENEELEEAGQQLAKEVKQYEEFADWVANTYPEVERGYLAIQKVRG